MIMKKLIFNILYVGILSVSLFSCLDDPEISPGLRGAGAPVFEDTSPVLGEKTASSVTISSKIIKENGSKITERGFYYGTNPYPLPENGGQEKNDETDNVGIGPYEIIIHGLINDTTYYFLPYAKNSIGTGYGKVLSVKTNQGYGNIETLPPNGILASAFITGIRVNEDGESSIERKGIYLYTRTDSTDRKSVV